MATTATRDPIGMLSDALDQAGVIIARVGPDQATLPTDVAKATGQPTDHLDPELAELSLDWARQNLAPQFRGDEASGMAFGHEVPVSSDAPPYDRLAGFFGRDPADPTGAAP